jgi:hypothetical protein
VAVLVAVLGGRSGGRSASSICEQSELSASRFWSSISPTCWVSLGRLIGVYFRAWSAWSGSRFRCRGLGRGASGASRVWFA